MQLPNFQKLSSTEPISPSPIPIPIQFDNHDDVHLLIGKLISENEALKLEIGTIKQRRRFLKGSKLLYKI